MAFRDDGGLLKASNNYPHYIIETAPLEDKMELNKNGLVIDVFPDATKSCDRFSNVKSNNYLHSVMAGLFAQKNNLDDAILLNTSGRVCETAIANLFIIKGNNIYTPPLSEGCVAGTMRRWMLEKFSQKEYSIAEKNILIEDVLNADEVFLTNAIQHLRWVKHFRGKDFGNEKAIELYKKISENIRV
jgi:branched-chain amino acid aminotransferase